EEAAVGVAEAEEFAADRIVDPAGGPQAVHRLEPEAGGEEERHHGDRAAEVTLGAHGPNLPEVAAVRSLADPQEALILAVDQALAERRALGEGPGADQRAQGVDPAQALVRLAEEVVGRQRLEDRRRVGAE